MTIGVTSVNVTYVTLPKDHCVEVPWKYIKASGHSDQFSKTLTEIRIRHTTRRMSDSIVSKFRRDKNTCSSCCFGHFSIVVKTRYAGLLYRALSESRLCVHSAPLI